jgi:hypothetical protein
MILKYLTGKRNKELPGHYQTCWASLKKVECMYVFMGCHYKQAIVSYCMQKNGCKHIHRVILLTGNSKDLFVLIWGCDLFLCPLVTLFGFSSPGWDMGSLSLFLLLPFCWMLCFMKVVRVLSSFSLTVCPISTHRGYCQKNHPNFPDLE